MSESVTIHRQETVTAAHPGFLTMIKDLELRPVYKWMSTNLNNDYTIEIRRGEESVDTVIVCHDPHDAMLLQITHGISNAVL